MQTWDHQQVDFWTAALPVEVWTLPAELAQVDQFLDDPAMLAPLAAGLDPHRGRPSLPVAQVLRLFYLQHRDQLSDRVVVQEVADSFHWRRFCHFGVTDPVPHPTSLTKWRRRLGPEGIAAVNAAVIHRLQTEKGVRGRRFRIDSTVVDADIHHPTDSGLLADGIRRLTRVARQVQAALPAAGPRIRDRARAVKHRILAIGKLVRRRTGDAVTQVRQITEALAQLGEAQLRTVHRVAAAVDAAVVAAGEAVPATLRRAQQRLTTAREQLTTVIAQSRAATAGERIPDRVVSLADPDARPIKKGKLGQPVQFGYKVQVWEAEGGLVTGYTGEQGNPADGEALIPALDQHRAQFGRDPALVATDRGYDSAANQKACRDRPIRTVAIPKRGKKSAARQRAEHRPAFRRAQRWRAGGEGTISRLKRQYGLRRSRYRGHDRVTTGVGLGVFAHNLHRYSRRVAG
jgi:IS5 family transposase